MEKFKNIRLILFFLGFAVLLISCESSTTTTTYRPQIVTPYNLPEATFGEYYSLTLEASGGKKPLTWSGDPPAGLKLDSYTGRISGSPKEVGSYRFDVIVTDSYKPKRYHSKKFLLTINSPSGEKLVVTTTSPLANARVGTPYKTSLAVSGAYGRLTWISENLLNEFTLDRSTGIIEGIPATAGVLVFDVKVVDKNQCAMKRFVLPVSGLLSLDSVVPRQGMIGQSMNVLIQGNAFQDQSVADFRDGITAMTNFISSTELNANITIAGDAALGPRELTITNPDNQSSRLADAFTVLADQPTERNIDISGINMRQNWLATVDGVSVDPVGNRVTIRVRPGDKITWRVRDADTFTHGVVFESESQMRNFLDIEQSQPLALRPDIFDPPENAFGTEGFGPNDTILMRATVKDVTSPNRQLNFTCFVHGTGRMDGTLILEP